MNRWLSWFIRVILAVIAGLGIHSAWAATTTYDFATSDQNWTAAVESGNTSNPFTWSSTAGVGGVGAWYTDGVATSSIKTLTSPEMEVASDGNVTVTIEHRHNFEAGYFFGVRVRLYDGGHLRYRVNGGSWTLVPRAQFSAGGYTSALLGNGIAGLNSAEGWSDTSANYAVPLYFSSVATIPGLTEGDTLELQLRAGWDSTVVWNAPNWVIGSVSVSNVVPEPAETALGVGLALLGWRLFRRRTSGVNPNPEAGGNRRRGK